MKAVLVLLLVAMAAALPLDDYVWKMESCSFIETTESLTLNPPFSFDFISKKDQSSRQQVLSFFFLFFFFFFFQLNDFVSLQLQVGVGDHDRS